ncbi:MAG TPA: MlaD family protein [Tepidisphaeraceae bacterium]|jgi:paraquat-inducible protein B|nr:MlaD family protein [Tepidisphaeraceae bacterium]
MTHSAADKNRDLPKPIKKKIRWPAAAIWIIPILAALAAAYYLHLYLADHGTEITIRLIDVNGLKPDETPVKHLGVEIGKVAAIQLSDDKQQAIVKVSLARSQEAFAQTGAQFWIVRPEVAVESVTGLDTVFSGPYIEAMPGSGESQTDFTGLLKAPMSSADGLKVMLRADHLEHLQSNSPVYYKGIQVGVIQNVGLAPDATHVDVHVLVWRRYSPLVRANSQFWSVSGADVQGGVFSGVKVRLDSLRSLIAGGIAFASPEKQMGDAANDGAEFTLYDEAKKDWQGWAPKIEINLDAASDDRDQSPNPP